MLQDQIGLERMAYVGFGSIWFTDFVLAHKVLRIDDMVSIESDDIGYLRAIFNLPYATVRVEHGYSAVILPKLFADAALAGRPWMIWLDYDYELNESVRDDVRSIIENAPTNSILIITVNGSEQKYGNNPKERTERLRNLLGSVVPDDLTPAACKNEQLQETLADLGLNFMKSIAADIARPGGFIEGFRVLYRDSSPMVTFGGILPARGAARTATEVVNAESWPARPSKAIKAPHLTMREAAVLQRCLPCATKLSRATVRELGFDLEEDQIEAFQTYYRQYPAFAQIVA